MSRDSVSVVGIGSLGFGRFDEESVASLANAALTRALDDCGLKRDELDGLLVHIGTPRGLDYDALARLLALDVRFSAQSWSHGRFMATVIQHAAMALSHGLADYAVCLGVFKNLSFGKHGTVGFPDFYETLREGGGPHAETPSVGLAAPVAGAAMATRRYLERYGIDREKLAAVALAHRRHAALNPDALARDPLARDDYLASPAVVEPLRRHDCSRPVDTAVAVILTTKDRARALAKPPVDLVAFQGISAGPNEFIFGQPGLGVNQAEVFDYVPSAANEHVFRASGLGPADVDTLHLYDGFTPQVLWTLERFGYCAPGDAADWIQDGRIELGGALPVNTSGGHLSEGHSNGWGHLVEIVRQLRGEAGPRQVAGARVAQWATTIGDSILFGADVA